MELFIAVISIFSLRLADQSLGTLRGLLVNKNKPFHAALVGLIESAIWIIAVSQVIKDINDPFLIFGYASGFSAGTLLGSYIDQIVGLGNAVIRIFEPIESSSVAKSLRKEGYPVTVIKGEGRDGDVRICWCIVSRRKTKAVLETIKRINPSAYVTVDFANPTSIKK
tara:strand:+ start:1393 stop:1893 length:501 start_codon:yes stop_codon:yes gene_type:complete